MRARSRRGSSSSKCSCAPKAFLGRRAPASEQASRSHGNLAAKRPQRPADDYHGIGQPVEGPTRDPERNVMKLAFLRRFPCLTGCAAALLATSPALAQQSTSTFDWAQSARIVQPSGPPSDEFGASIALGADTLAIGAP